MLTRCPECRTTFRVTPAQLKARAGKVRCGRCQFVFNALDTLNDGEASVVAAPSAAPQAMVEAPPILEPADNLDALTSVAEPVAPGAEMDDDVLDIGAPDVSDDAAAAVALVPPDNVYDIDPHGTGPLRDPEMATPALTDYLADPPLAQEQPPTRRWPWVTGSVIAVLSLLLQAIYYYRVEIAVLQPDLRPLLLSVCQRIGCDVPRPRHIDLLSIDSSDLHPEPKQAGHLTLNATLRSKADFVQEWPVLELTLTDVADHKLAVKDFKASDYLPKESDNRRRLDAGMPANADISISLPMDVGDLPAAGYRLYIFYP